MLGAPQPSSPTPGYPVFWGILGRLIAQLIGERAHADVVLTLKDGAIQFVRVNRTFLPGNLPKV